MEIISKQLGLNMDFLQLIIPIRPLGQAYTFSLMTVAVVHLNSWQLQAPAPPKTVSAVYLVRHCTCAN